MKIVHVENIKQVKKTKKEYQKELNSLHIIDNLLDRFREEDTKLVCEGRVLLWKKKIASLFTK